MKSFESCVQTSIYNLSLRGMNGVSLLTELCFFWCLISHFIADLFRGLQKRNKHNYQGLSSARARRCCTTMDVLRDNRNVCCVTSLLRSLLKDYFWHFRPEPTLHWWDPTGGKSQCYSLQVRNLKTKWSWKYQSLELALSFWENVFLELYCHRTGFCLFCSSWKEDKDKLHQWLLT